MAKKFKDFLEEAVHLAEAKEYHMTGSDRHDAATVHGKKVGVTKQGHHIIAADVTHNHYTKNKQYHSTYVVHHETGKLLASHDAKSATEQKAAVKHAKTADFLAADHREPAKNWYLHTTGNATLKEAFVAEATTPHGMSRKEYAAHELSGKTDKSKDPIDVGFSHNKNFGDHKPKVGDRVTLGPSKSKRGTIHAINSKKTVAGVRKFHHVKWDDGTEDEHMRDHSITVWRHR